MSKFLDITGLGTFKNKIDAQIKAEVAKADHLKRQIVEQLPDTGSADENTIYMKLNDGEGRDDKYNEYMLINGEFELIGNSAVDLTDYATKTEVNSAKDDAIAQAKEYTDSKASDYATAAQGKKADSAVQSVKIGTKELNSSGNVVLPKATTSADGLMASTDKKKLDELVPITDSEINALFE